MYDPKRIPLKTSRVGMSETMERCPTYPHFCPLCGSGKKAVRLRVKIMPGDHPFITKKTDALCGDPWHTSASVAPKENQ